MTDLELAEHTINRLLDRLAVLAGLHGSRGWAEIECDLNGRRTVLPLTIEGNSKVQYARKVLKEFGRSPAVE